MIRLREQTKYFLIDGKRHFTSQFPYVLYQTEKPVYEVIKYNKTLFYYEEHQERMKQSLHQLGYAFAQGIFPSKSEIEKLFQIHQFTEGNVRIDYFPLKKSAITFLIPYFYPPAEYYVKGVDLAFQNDERPQQNVKIYRPELKNKTQTILQENDVFETLLVNQQQEITEGSRSNVFFIQNHELFTPPLEQVLPGITRQAVFSFALNHHINIHEKIIPMLDVQKFESCFITGTSIGVLPVNKIENYVFQLKNPLLQKLIKGFQ